MTARRSTVRSHEISGSWTSATRSSPPTPSTFEQMALVNHLCSWICRYVERFACMKLESLQAYLDWFVYLHRVHRDEDR